MLQIKGGCSIIYMNIEEIWGKNNMAHIRDIDISKLNIDESLKPYIAEALIELDDLFDEKDGINFFLQDKLKDFMIILLVNLQKEISTKTKVVPFHMMKKQ